MPPSPNPILDYLNRKPQVRELEKYQMHLWSDNGEKDILSQQDFVKEIQTLLQHILKCLGRPEL